MFCIGAIRYPVVRCYDILHCEVISAWYYGVYDVNIVCDVR